MNLDHPIVVAAWKFIGFCSQTWVGLALLGIVPGFSHTDGWFARIVGPVLLLSAALQVISLLRKRPV